MEIGKKTNPNKSKRENYMSCKKEKNEYDNINNNGS